MKCVQIEEIKPFMAKLFGTDFFYDFVLIKAEIKTYASFILDGKNPKESGQYVSWEQISNVIFQIIKGKRSPGLLFLVMEPKKEWLEQRIKNTEGFSFCLNIRFEQKEGERRPEDSLMITAGVSGVDFIRASRIEQEWNRIVADFLKEHEICFRCE